MRIVPVTFVFIIFAAMLGNMAVFHPVLAADEYGLETVSGRSGLQKFRDVPTATGRFLGGALSMVGVLFFILTLYGGILWMTSHGNTEQANKGLHTLVSAIVGLIVVLSAYTLTRFVFSTVRGGEQTGSNGNSGAACSRDKDCRAGLSCVSGVCQPASAAAGGSFPTNCLRDADCGARGKCENTGDTSGFCIDLCDQSPNSNSRVTSGHSCRDRSACDQSTIVLNLCRGGSDRVCCAAK